MAKVALISPYNYSSMPVRLLHRVLDKAGHEAKSIFFKRHRLDRMAPPTDEEYELLHRTIDELEPTPARRSTSSGSPSSLTQFSLVPRALIRALANSEFFRRRPILLNNLVKPLGRAGERLRWIRLYVKECGMRVTIGRYLKKLSLAVRSDNAGARAVWGAD